ncbi:hypothetical protein AB0333_06415 [Citricoccus sp. NPDC079358]|jgi:hypothetical protein|uniref:hypothetical protein n=1 Tax=Micrococcaceae TaxID=1268 RepID=UPI0002D5767A|nr:MULTISPECIES: hypothetical protein [Micrococcaceae]MDP9985906.1 hypothetical protein [Arthrobacter oryzae]
MTHADPNTIREALQKAADDLLEGRATGPLTGVRLAELAGVKRHRLTHDNPDINAAFQERAREINRSKPEVDALRTQLAYERERASRLAQERDALARQLRNYATALLAVTEERDRLLDRLQTSSNVTLLRAADHPRK